MKKKLDIARIWNILQEWECLLKVTVILKKVCVGGVEQRLGIGFY